MKRIHAVLIALVLAVAVILGSFAAIRSTQLSASSSVPRVDAAQIARQNAALDRAEQRLRAELAKKPPAVPAASAAAAPAQTVIYKRPPAIVHVVHRSGEHESGDHEGGHDD